MPAPDDFTKTLLHAMQNERTTPQGGWLNQREMARGMALTAAEARHLSGPLQELMDAGMIERRFNADKAVDEWRSRGVQPDLRAIMASPGADAPDGAPLRPHPADTEGAAREVFIYLYRHGGHVTDAELMQGASLDLGTLWHGLDQLEAAGLIQRRADGHAVRLHEYVRDMLA
jgi:hypothetical protein